MVDSILTSIKKLLGLDESQTAFDVDIVIHINSALATLNQLGIGPEFGFTIDDAAPKWIDFLGDNQRLNPVKTYVYLRVRLLFDPPATSFAIDAIKDQISELEWRLNVERETGVSVPVSIVDGGDAGEG